MTDVPKIFLNLQSRSIDMSARAYAACAFITGLLVSGLASSAGIDAAAKEKQQGGQGVIRSVLYRDSCIPVDSELVREVCAEYAVNWKLWSLMGEPVGDYRLKWNLVSIKLMDEQRKQPVSYTPATLPKALEKAVSRIELYIDGLATVGGQSLSHRFNTGVAVRANSGMSHNVPGSPDWSRLFARGVSACTSSNMEYLSTKEAKAVFVKGITLDSIRLCPESSVGELSWLNSAVNELCQAPGSEKRYRFCPSKNPGRRKVPQNATIDEAFSALEGSSGNPVSADGKHRRVIPASGIESGFTQMEAEKEEDERRRTSAEKVRIAKAERERLQQQRHQNAVEFCKAALRTTGQCVDDVCRSEPSQTICTESKKNPAPPCNCSPEPCGCMVFDSYTCLASGPNPKYAEWAACRKRAVVNQCRREDSVPLTQEACVAQHEQDAAREQSGSDDSLHDRLRKKLREAVRCKPEKGEKCQPVRNGGSGLRG